MPYIYVDRNKKRCRPGAPGAQMVYVSDYEDRQNRRSSDDSYGFSGSGIFSSGDFGGGSFSGGGSSGDFGGGDCGGGD